MVTLLKPYRKLDNDKRYTIVTGGRGSAKSFHINVFALLLTYNKGEVILFTRYTMTSAEKSIIPEFREKIEMFGVESHFEVTAKEITNKHTGSRIIFSGIKTSSGNQTANLKSINGLTCWILDEAEEMYNEEEFDKIVFSVRKKGVKNRIIISLNPCDTDHWIYERFFEGGKLENTQYIHTTYKDNLANLDDDFIKEAEYTRINNPKKYDRVFLGKWGSSDDKIFTGGFTLIDEEELPRQENVYKWRLYGGDFGYTNDPTAVCEVIRSGNRLYLHEWCYDTGMLNPQIASFMVDNNLVDEISVWDSADGNKSVNELILGGVPADGATKGPGSLYWGIEKIKQFDVFITRSSKNLIKEWRAARWARDNSGKFKRNTKGQKVPHVSNPPKDHLIDCVRYAVSYYEDIHIIE